MDPVNDHRTGSDVASASLWATPRSGLVTLAFTDLVGSTALKQQLGDNAGVALVQEHHALVRQLLKEFPQGQEISTAGDSFFLVFVRPSDAVRFALLLQTRLVKFNQGRSVALQDRVGLHLGEVVIEETGAGKRDLHGMQVDTCARVMSLAQAGQILMSRPVFDNARQSLKGEEVEGVAALEWLNHGRFELKGLGEPIEICEVRVAGSQRLSSPKTSEKARRVESEEGEAVLGWRPARGLTVKNTPWVLQEKLGEGGFGEVWLAEHPKLKERRVFKFCFRADRVRALKRELTLFRLVREHAGEHSRIVRLHEVYLDEPPYYLEEEFVEGKDLRTWCESQGGAAKVPLTVRLELVAQAAEGLQAAHDSGIIHRDVKPGNILVSASTAAPSVKLTDFGIGQVISAEYLRAVTQTGFTQTALSTSSGTGTTMYLPPEVIAGAPATTRSDIYSLGVVLYQLLVGDFKPVATDWAKEVADPLLREDLQCTFAGNPQDRFAEAAMLARNLRDWPQRKRELEAAEREALKRKTIQRRWKVGLFAGSVVLVLGLGLGLGWLARWNTKVRWAREKALPGIAQLRAQGDVASAFALARQAQKYLAADPEFTNAWSQISVSAYLDTEPSGADVYVKPYKNASGPWEYLGKSPVESAVLPRGFYRWRLVKAGYEPLEMASHALSRAAFLTDSANRPLLESAERRPAGMVRVRGGLTYLFLGGLEGCAEPVELGDFYIDKCEVSNRHFLQFVNAGGYDNTNYWKHPFVQDGKTLTWAEALSRFRDGTGQPGPAAWRGGNYPEGQADYPVSGVSWYEADAYAQFAGKRLPSIFHWVRAARPELDEFVVPQSNFSKNGAAPVGSYAGMSWCGACDMAGNIKEWCWNQAEDDRRYVLGGAWGEPEYMSSDPDAQHAFDRSPKHGFRCMQLASSEVFTDKADARLVPLRRDFSKEKPVTEEVFEIYKTLFAYDKTALNARVEEVDTNTMLWRREKVSLAAAYGNERLLLHVFLPRKARPPYQAVVVFPGSSAIGQTSIDQSWLLPLTVKPLVDIRRGVVVPVFKSTWERSDELKSSRPAGTRMYRDHVIQWSKDLGRTIDYLEQRPDIRKNELAFLGVSWGAAMGAILPALEDRLKTSILVAGGFYFQRALPEAEQINFAPRIRMPTLMINGRYDFAFPAETSQGPMFRLLGAPVDHKRHVIFDTGHAAPGEPQQAEIATWLDRYLGPVK